MIKIIDHLLIQLVYTFESYSFFYVQVSKQHLQVNFTLKSISGLKQAKVQMSVIPEL